VRINSTDGAAMVWVPGGEFLMGVDLQEIDAIWRRLGWPEKWKARARLEAPMRRVRVDGFWLYRTEITNAQYRRFCQSTGHRAPAFPISGPGVQETWKDSRFNGPQQPVVGVSWEDAQAYCLWVNARLPTEAEWERAARGTATGVGGTPRRLFVWGNDLPRAGMRVANLADESARKRSPRSDPSVFLSGYDDGYAFTAPVGRFPPSDFGLYDMAGNVWEWCADWYAEGYSRSATTDNPQGPPTGRCRAQRGGSFFIYKNCIFATSRDDHRPHATLPRIGFRPARSEL
jgi:formylglycine-generating enzyme required for sulfatase activity